MRDAHGKPIYDTDPKRPWQSIARMRTVFAEVTVCPKCGQPPRGANGVVLSETALRKKQNYCTTRYLQEIGTADRPDRAHDSSGLDRIMPAPKAHKDDDIGRIVEHEGRTYEVRACGEPLFQARIKPRKDSTKWSIAKILQRKAKKLFHFMVLDEMHEHKGENSAQARASAKAMSAARKIVGLTGTLIGGYANHLYPLLWRMSPRSLVAEGFDYHRDKAFVQQYGRIDTIYKTKYGDDLGRWRGRNRGTNSIRGDGKTTTDIKYKPGVMPHFFGNHLISKGLFLSLSEMAEGLPPLVDDDRSLIAVPMDQDLHAAYKQVEGELHAALVELLQAGSMKLLGAFMRTCLDFPDKPFGWEPPYPNTKAIGYWDDAKNKTRESYTSVCQPPDLGLELRNKEKALLDLVMKEHAEGRQCWIYLVMTKKRDIQPRLAKMLEERRPEGQDPPGLHRGGS